MQWYASINGELYSPQITEPSQIDGYFQGVFLDSQQILGQK